jgi:FkbM family methyltransferase
MARVYDHPVQMLRRYLLKQGEYPFVARLKSPAGPLSVTLHSYHDLLTVNEIFCRGDYSIPGQLRTVVDFGSNIGISGLYFLTRNPDVRVKLFEPVPANIEKLRETLRAYESRYELFPVAVGTEEGEVDFGAEPTGRYGGIGKSTGTTFRIHCREANTVLAEILTRPGFAEIDLLKIDIEGLEGKVVSMLRPEVLAHLRWILAELEGTPPGLPGFGQDRCGPIARWHRIS